MLGKRRGGSGILAQVQGTLTYSERISTRRYNRLKAMKLIAVLLAIVWVGILGLPIALAAQTQQTDTFTPGYQQVLPPERAISFAVGKVSITVAKGEEVQVELNMVNDGKRGEEVELSVTRASPGWDTGFRPLYKSYNISALYVQAGKVQEFEFRAKPPKDVAEGKYAFALQASTKDGQLTSSIDVSVTVTGSVQTREGVKLSTQYPTLSGPSTSKFEFKVDLINEGNQDRSFDLRARGPAQWSISIRPAWEQKEISTVRVKAGQTQGLDISLTPPLQVSAGEFTTTMQAASGAIQDAIELKATITGTYRLNIGTTSGRLNTDLTAGEERDMAIVVANKGTAPLQGVTFSSSKPDGWAVTFSPDRIDSLAQDNTLEIAVKIKAPANTIPGDYAVTMRASAEQASESMDIRVTATVPTLWGWVGIVIVVLVVAGLGTVFAIMGRR